ncbi:universal stress protein [Magnetospira sp. QH-2]|uniref:universal stress protein n=1 Tax=Magnetospira sp. (strain QH-2) TaxID=1288970 RepID=UPI0003E81571|nr:universal stress protein [Magnetospira sp. QH-2]CCQ73637.1 Stress-induced protein. Universal stress protein A UspA [Magnetospira sp. QH-2]
MYNDVLLAIDLDDDSSWSKALPVALEFVRNSDGMLHVMTVVPNFGMSIVGQFFPKGYEEELGTKILQTLKDFVANHVPKDVKVQHIVGEGTVYEVILKIAGKINADMIVVASGRDDLKDFLLGPNAARVVRHAKCSVTVVR